MANPFSIQSIASLPKGAGQGTDNITNITGTAKFARGLGSVNQSASLRFDNIISLKYKLNATATTGNKIASFYLITSSNGTDWTDGIDPDATSDQSSKISHAPCFHVQTGLTASTTYYVPEISVPAFLGFQSLYWAVVYQLDLTAGGFSATAGDHLTKYTEIQYA